LSGREDLPANIIPTRHSPNSRSDPHTSCVNREPQRSQHVIEENAVFHAIPSSTSLVSDDFLEDDLWVERDTVVGGVVQEEVLIGYAAELVDVEGCEVGDVEWRVGGFSEARGEQDVRFILGDLGWGVC